ncbi:cytochrome P450 302a1, mitochondrial-like [Centruroides sculpturatus]|uniref:cytochrome P450 302a1, mitochondrial-like n=1 Tax=Centruroides sculpturatus TaxID=218467 RepID=UPI000C6D3A08|nr:cytochrome P450 302a1, mitochondrial-like [Centruroides sculpturatus]
MSMSRVVKPFQAIPGPKRWPILGHFHLFSPWGPYSFEKIMDAFQDLWKKYGSIVRLDLGTPLIVLFDPNDIQELYIRNGSFPHRPVFEALKYYRTSKPHMYKSSGIVVENGEEWWRLRRQVNWMLLSEVVQFTFPKTVNLADDFVKRVRLIRDDKNEIGNFLKEIYRFTLEASALVCFGKRFSNFDEKAEDDILTATEDTLESMGKTLLEPPLWKLIKTPIYRKLEESQDFFYRTSKQIVETFKTTINQSTEKHCFLLNKLINNQNLDNADVILLLMEIFSAGVDATGITLAYLLYNLAKNPDKQDILYEEIKNFDDSPNELQKYIYLKACIKESMRLLPTTGGTARILTDDLILRGYRVPRGTTCFGMHPLIGKSSEYFLKASDFVPERWIRENGMLEEKIHPYAILPFGHGRRRCVGQRIAEQEMQIFITKMLKNFRVQFPNEDINCVMRLQLVPDRPLLFRFIDRS